MQPLPEHLKHKSVFSIPYEQFDGIYAGKTDVKYLSVGLAQYDDKTDTQAVSVKTMRHVGGRWSRQSEELPLHRVADLTLFMAKALFAAEDGKVTLPAETFDNQPVDLNISMNKNRSEKEMEEFHSFMDENCDQLKQRLNTLADVLIELRKSGKI